ncbi:Rgp1-domain-containing protein [Apodospora peruviana]|uniref:Rgp1-domain-containing protein n=1 Tax=Apodospora peruviana TaxID=516989 RepID=A0AAE0HYU7_9PEZI|nr:Rgp1-domain-containing protein [Apodospora peruviana]
MPPSDVGPNGTSSTNTNTNIRVFVRWQDQVVFAGEDVKCTITFKNVAPVPGSHQSPASTLPLGSGLLSPKPPSSRQVSAERRHKTNAAAAAGLAPPTSRGHRSTLSLTVPSASASAAASRSRSGSIPWSPTPLDSSTTHSARNGNGNGHKRSVSIVSNGSVHTVSGGGNQNNISSSSTAKPQRPARSHARASSLQIVPRSSQIIGPRSATVPQRLYNPQSSPLFHASYPPDRATFNDRPSGVATAPDTPRVGFSRASPTYRSDMLSGFKFPMTQSPSSPGTGDNSPLGLGETSLMSPTGSVGETTSSHGHLPTRPARGEPAVPTINEHGAMLSARVLATTSIGGTPRSSGEFYSLSNNSSETLASEYVTQQPLRQPSGRSAAHTRRASNLSSSLSSRVSPEALMMGYAQVQGSFTLDGSLVNLGPFEQVKRKAVVGGHGGGVIGVETTKRDSGLLRGFGWGNITSSIGELLGGSELSTIKEMRGIASSKSIPLLSTPQSILFVDLQLAPGESKSFEYAFKLPKGLPPTHRGKAMKISYSLVIGTQRPGGAREQQVKSVDIPFRVLGSVNNHGEILGHDLMAPYIILRDQARVQSLDKGGPHQRQQLKSTQVSLSDKNSFFSYVDELLTKPEDGPPAALLSPTATHPPSRRQSVYSILEDPAAGVTTAKEAIDLAILRANLTSGRQAAAANRFEIARNGRHVGVVMLARPAYRLGEQITMAVDFSGAEIPCYAVHAALETAERVDSSLALRSEASVHRVTRKVVVAQSEATLYSRRIVFMPTIPSNATPEFVTSGVCLEWKIRLEFVVPAHVDDGRSSQAVQRRRSSSDSTVHQDDDRSEDDDAGEEQGLQQRKNASEEPQHHSHRQSQRSGDDDDGDDGGGSDDDHRESRSDSSPPHPLLEVISRDERGGLVMVALEHLPCESFEVAVPLRVYGAVCNGLERLERDEAMDGGLAV